MIDVRKGRKPAPIDDRSKNAVLEPLPPGVPGEAILALGRPVETLRLRGDKRRRALAQLKLGVAILLTALAGIGYAIVKHPEVQGWVWAGSVLIGLAGLLVIAISIDSALRTRPFALWRCPAGVIYDADDRLGWFRWEDAKEFRGWGRDVEVKLAVSFVEFPVGTEQEYRFRIVAPDGTRFVIDHTVVPGRRTFFYNAMLSSLEAATPAFAERIESGQTVDFLRFQLDDYGVTFRGELQPWDAISYVTRSKGSLRVHLKDGRIWEDRLSRISHYLVLIRLIDAVTETLNPPSGDVAIAEGKNPFDFCGDE